MKSHTRVFPRPRQRAHTAARRYQKHRRNRRHQVPTIEIRHREGRKGTTAHNIHAMAVAETEPEVAVTRVYGGAQAFARRVQHGSSASATSACRPPAALILPTPAAVAPPSFELYTFCIE